jgi:hypothetical protein
VRLRKAILPVAKRQKSMRAKRKSDDGTAGEG